MNEAQWKLEFSNRFRRHGDELELLYSKIYRGNARAFEAFVEMLYRTWEARPESLKALDRARDQQEDWYRSRSLTGMQLDVKAFAKDLKQAKEKLDYLAECGVNCLFLQPLMESGHGYGDGYAVCNPRRIRPDLGTEEDLVRFADACREKGMSVCVDFPLNHTDDTHEWAMRAKAGEKEYQRRYFLYDTWDLPNAYEQTMQEQLPLTAPGCFTWNEEMQAAVMTTFHAHQWDLNYAQPAVFNGMMEDLLFLCNSGADVIRLGGLPYLWKALGTSCRGLPQVHTLARLMRLMCEIVCPGTLLLGDVSEEPGSASAYFGSREKPECHLLCNTALTAALWHTVATREVRLLTHEIEKLTYLPKGCTFLHALHGSDAIAWNLDYGFMRQFAQDEMHHRQYLNDYFTGRWPGSPALGETCTLHPLRDTERLCGATASLCGIEAARRACDHPALQEALQLDQTLHALLFTLSGMPVLYSGDEIAQESDRGYGNDPEKARDKRSLHRGDMNWQKAENRTHPNTVEYDVFHALAQLKALRSSEDVFDDTADVGILNPSNEHILALCRQFRGKKLLALFNFDREEQVAWLHDLNTYKNLVTNEEEKAGSVTLPARGFKWLLFEDKELNYAAWMAPPR